MAFLCGPVTSWRWQHQHSSTHIHDHRNNWPHRRALSQPAQRWQLQQMARVQLLILLGSSAECLRTFPFCVYAIANCTRMRVCERSQTRSHFALHSQINMCSECVCARSSAADSNGNSTRKLRLRIRHVDLVGGLALSATLVWLVSPRNVLGLRLAALLFLAVQLPQLILGD